VHVCTTSKYIPYWGLHKHWYEVKIQMWQFLWDVENTVNNYKYVLPI